VKPLPGREVRWLSTADTESFNSPGFHRLCSNASNSGEFYWEAKHLKALGSQMAHDLIRMPLRKGREGLCKSYVGRVKALRCQENNSLKE